MEIDMKKLETAIIYLQRIADGNNPVNNMPADEDSVLNNPNVIRCMYFVKEVLEKVYDNNGHIQEHIKKSDKPTRAENMFPFEVLEKFEYREDKTINNLINQIYEPVKDTNIRKISGKKVNDWLIASGFVIEKYSNELKKNIKVPTEKGTAIGLRAERVEYLNKVYVSIYYNKNAQEFFIKNLEKFINGEVLK